MVVEDIKGPISGFAEKPKTSWFNIPNAYGEIHVESLGQKFEESCVFDWNSDISGLICFDDAGRIRGRIYLRNIGPVWGNPSRIRRTKEGTLVMVFENLVLLRPMDEVFRLLFNSLPDSIQESIIGRIIRLIQRRFINYRPTLITDEVRTIALRTVKERTGRMSFKRRKKMEEKNEMKKLSTWKKISDGVYRDTASKEDRMKLVCKYLDEVAEILET